ncbi:hypothetical protein JST97_23285 [bacterium]|nr:hypothetical protein [bacterium]
MNGKDDANTKPLLSLLSKATRSNEKAEFKSFILFVQDDAQHLKALNTAEKADNVGLALLKGANDEAIAGYKISTAPEVKNTVIVYRNRKATAVFVNWTPSDSDKLNAAISAAVND